MVGINSRQTLASTSTIPRSNGLGFIPFDLMVFIRSPSSSVHCRPSFIRLHLRSLPTARLHPLTFIRSPSSSVHCRPMLSFVHWVQISNRSHSRHRRKCLLDCFGGQLDENTRISTGYAQNLPNHLD